jgi:YVTN family beta-propeller protein
MRRLYFSSGTVIPPRDYQLAAFLLAALVLVLAEAQPVAAQPYAYVVGQRSPFGTPALVSVINTASNTIVATIPVGGNCLCVNPDSIAIVPDLSRVYVSNEAANSVSVISTASDSVVATIGVGTGPTAIVANLAGTRVYVVNGSGVTSVSEIDTATNAVVRTTPLAVLQARGMAITSDGSQLYISVTAPSPTVKVIDTASMSITATIPVGNLPYGAGVTPDGGRAYVASYSSNTVSEIDTQRNTVTRTIPVGGGANSARVAPDGTRAYVANTVSSTISVIDLQTNVVVATIPVTTNPRTLEFLPDGTRFYVANSGNVQVINTATNAIVATVPFNAATHGSPAAIAIGRATGGNAPTAVNNRYSTSLDTVLEVPVPGVLANDYTNGGGRMTAQLVTDVTNGTLALDVDGSFTYTPPSGFLGTDTFVYRAVNSVGNSNLATVAITAGGAAPPSAANDAYNVAFNTTLNVAAPGVLGNDSSNGGGPLNAQLVSNISSGTLALAADGSFAYTPATGFSGSTTFTYRAVNAGGSSNVATVSISVSPAAAVQPPSGLHAASISGNVVTLRWAAPAAGPSPTGYVLEGGVLPGDVLASLPTGSAAPEFTFTAPNGAFYVRIRALAGAARSSASNEIRIFVNVPAPPSPPAGLLGLVDNDNLSLAWRNTSAGGAATSLLLDVSGALSASLPLPIGDSFSFVAVPPGTYTFRLRAVNAAGPSSASNPVTLTFPGSCSGVPLAPVDFVASKSGNQISATWNPAASGPAPTGFVLTVTGTFSGAIPTALRSLSGAVGPGSYTLSVRGTNPCGSGPSTPPQTVNIP